LRRLRPRTADVELHGVGDVVLWVTDELNVEINGFGDVRYSRAWLSPSASSASAT
jgi:hypothetical protein